MNLENFGLVELNAQEVQEIDGGILPFLALLIAPATVALAAAAVVVLAAGIAGSFQAGYNSVRHH
jgi:lactobin A/cerein 7B family class IIb bacteriocin